MPMPEHQLASPRPAGPRTSGPLWIALGLVILLMGLFTLRQVASPDVGFHLTAGQHILDGHGWPRTDPFTFTVNDREYIDTSWGFQVVLAAVERSLGTPGMVFLAVGLVLALFGMLALTARLLPSSLHLLILLLLLGGLAAEPRFEVRPELVSYLLLALVLYLLHRHAEGLGAPLWLIPPIFLVWANFHSLFILGWAAMLCFFLGTTLRHRRPDLPLLGWAAGGVAACLVNPYGYKAVLFPFTLSTRMQGQNVFARSIGEFGSPLQYAVSDQLMFYLVPLAAFFAFALLVLLSLRRLLRQKRYWCVLLGLVFLPLALTMIRNIPLLTVACLPAAVWGLSIDPLMEKLRLRGGRRRVLGYAAAFVLIAVVILFSARTVTDAYYIDSRRLERFGLGWNGLALPVGAAAHAASAGLEGRALNHLNFGGYLMWARDEPVFIDGRLEVMGEAFYEEYRRALDSKQGISAAVGKYGIRWIVFPYRLRPDLLRGLSADRDWRLAYVDHLAAIFVPAGSPESWIHDSARRANAASTPSTDVGTLPGFGGRARDRGGFLRRPAYPIEPFNRGVFHYTRGRPARAAHAFAEAIRDSGGAFYEIYNNLGSALAALGRYEEARACYRIFLEDLPAYRIERRRSTLDRLAEVERRLP